MKNSAMRYMCIISLIGGIGITMFGMFLGMSPESIVLIASVFVVPAFTGKIMQKNIESKKND